MPGQVIYNTTRQLVLRGVDGIVFVADSQYEKMPENVESFQNLMENLGTLKRNLDDIRYVLDSTTNATCPTPRPSNTWSSC